MAAALPGITAIAGGLSVGQTLFPGLLGGQADAGSEVPTFEQPQPSSVDDEILSQTDRNIALRRQAASKSKSLTSLQNSPVTEDSLLRIIARGK